MKRFTLSVVMTAVLGVAAYSWSGAQGPGREPGRRRPGGPGFGREMALLRGADLTDQQQAEIEAIRDAARDVQAGPPADAALRRQLDAELFADAPDAGKIAALQEQLIRSQGQRLAKEIATAQKIVQVLTAEQRAKIRERLGAAPARRGRASQLDGPRGDRRRS